MVENGDDGKTWLGAECPEAKQFLPRDAMIVLYVSMWCARDEKNILHVRSRAPNNRRTLDCERLSSHDLRC